MEQEKKQAIALMRYSAIAPLIAGIQEDYESLSAYFRTVSAKGIKAPRLCDCPDRRCQPVYPGGRCRAMVPLHRSAFSISMTTPL